MRLTRPREREAGARVAFSPSLSAVDAALAGHPRIGETAAGLDPKQLEPGDCALHFDVASHLFT